MNREILRLAIPNIISNIAVPLLSSVDTALMGRLSTLHIGAVGLGAMIFNFAYWNFGFLRMGTTGLTAQAFGRQSPSEQGQILVQALGIGLGVGLILLSVGGVLEELAAGLLQIQPDQEPLVHTYFRIRLWDAPATLALYACMGWFFGMQNARIPLLLTVLGNVLNILLSLYFVAELHWAVAGVAWGTVIAQYATLILALGVIAWRYGLVIRAVHWAGVWQGAAMSRFLRVNRDILLRTFCLTLAFGFFYRQSSAAGPTLLAVNVILLQFLNWMSYGVDGFAYAAESIVGKYAGAGDTAVVDRAIRRVFGWGMALAALYSAVYGIGGTGLVGLFTNQEDVLIAVKPYLWWMVLFPLIGTPSYLWDGIYIGLTAAKAMRNTMLASLLVFAIGLWSLQPWLNNQGLWLSLLLFLGARGVFQYALFRRKGMALMT